MGPQLLHALNYVSAGNLQIIYWNFMELSDFRSAVRIFYAEPYPPQQGGLLCQL